MKGILAYTEEELVSIDFRGNPNSSIVDTGYTRVVGTNCLKVLAWYDNEWGYSCRCRDLIKFLAAKPCSISIHGCVGLMGLRCNPQQTELHWSSTGCPTKLRATQ